MKLYPRNKLLAGCLALAFVLALSTTAGAQHDAQQPALPTINCPLSGQDAAVVTSDPARTDYQTDEPRKYIFANGLYVTLYTSETLERRIEWDDGEAFLQLVDGRSFNIITDIGDPAIYNKGDGTFHPFQEDKVVEILSGISHPNMKMDVVVYLLPYPRRSLLVSSTSDNVVFLSPHVLEIPSTVCAYIVAHEIGHVFHNAYMPEGSPLWDSYRWIRGITDLVTYAEIGPHAYRPKEIFAEDFRVLYGGSEAAHEGQIENPVLPSPLDVAGLQAFFDGIGGIPLAMGPKVLASNYPNPFNPDTEIRIMIPEEIVSAQEKMTVRIYDVSGALVRELYSDVPFDENLYVRWDGCDHHGSPVASSNYFALIDAGRTKTSLKLVLLK